MPLRQDGQVLALQASGCWMDKLSHVHLARCKLWHRSFGTAATAANSGDPRQMRVGNEKRERRGSTAPIWGFLLTAPVLALRAARLHPTSTHPNAVAVVLNLQQGLAAILARHAAGMGEGRPAAAGCMPCCEQAGLYLHVACAHQQGCVQPPCASPLTQSVLPLHPGCSPTSPSARWRAAAVEWVAGDGVWCVSEARKQHDEDEKF